MSASPEQPGGTELARGVFAPPGAIRLQSARASGPGGQNVNKVNTRMELWLDLSQLTGLRESALARLRHMAGKRLTDAGLLHLSAGEHRSQEANRQTLFDRLRTMIQQARIEPKVRRKTKPTRSSQRARYDAKKRRGEVKSQRRSLDY
jgi:ribosome-associated protein